VASNPPSIGEETVSLLERAVRCACGTAKGSVLVGGDGMVWLGYLPGGSYGMAKGNRLSGQRRLGMIWLPGLLLVFVLSDFVPLFQTPLMIVL